MQLAFETHPRENYEPFDLEVTLPGKLRRIVTTFAEPNLIIPAGMGKPPVAELKALPALIFQIDPDKPKAKRSFVWVPLGVKLEWPGQLVYLDSYIDEKTGQPFFLFEAIKTKKA